MKCFIHNKTLWMNFVLSIFFMLSSAFYFFLNIDYVEASLLGKLYNLTLLLVPGITAFSLYKNNSKLLYKTSFILNIIISIILFLLIIKALTNHRNINAIVTFVFLTPFLINLCQINKIKNRGFYE